MTVRWRKARFILVSLIGVLGLMTFIEILERGGQEVPLVIKILLAGLVFILFFSRLNHLGNNNGSFKCFGGIRIFGGSLRRQK